MKKRTVQHRSGRAALLSSLIVMICAARGGIALPPPTAAITSDVTARIASLGFGGSATYTGQMGPVSEARLICICVSSDPNNLRDFLGCYEVATNGGSYFVATFNMKTYFVVAFLDLNPNITLDPGEPYEIYNGRSLPPGDPVTAGLSQTAINFSFGDENLWPPPVLTPTATPSRTPTRVPTQTETATPSDTQKATPTPSASPTAAMSSPTEEPTATETPSPTSTPAGNCRGDCNGSGDVTINELVTLVNIALENAPISSCVAGDADESGMITVDEIVAAVNAALSGCTI